MKKFANLFSYETTNFDGRYRNCTLLEDVHYPNSKSAVFALAGEVFPTVIVDLNTCDVYFFEEFDDHVPMFTIKFKFSYI